MGRIVELAQGTPEWLDWRRLGLGGSDAPVVEGLSPYRTPLQLAREKVGMVVDDEDENANEFIFSRGHAIEKIIRKEFQKLVGEETAPVCMVHSKFDYIRASLDGFNPKLGVLEAKLVGQEALAEARNGNLPAHHYSQMQHQFAVSDADVGQWFGHDGKKGGVLLEVRANKPYIDKLLEKEHRFWDELMAGKMPALSDRDYLIPDDLTLLQELRDAKELAENAQTQFDNLKAEIVKKYQHPKIAGAGLKLFKVSRQGALSLLKVPEIEKAAEEIKAKLDAEYLEKFRGKSSESWTIRLDK